MSDNIDVTAPLDPARLPQRLMQTQPLAVLTRTPGTPALRRSPADPVPVAPTLPNPKRWAVREQREAAKLERREAARHERETLRLQRIEEKRREREDAKRQARDEESAMRRRIALAEEQQATRLAAITYVPGTLRAKMRARREAAQGTGSGTRRAGTATEV